MVKWPQNWLKKNLWPGKSTPWGQKDYPSSFFFSRRIILGNSMCFLCTQEVFWGINTESPMKNCLTKLFSNELGNVFVPSGNSKSDSESDFSLERVTFESLSSHFHWSPESHSWVAFGVTSIIWVFGGFFGAQRVINLRCHVSSLQTRLKLHWHSSMCPLWGDGAALPAHTRLNLWGWWAGCSKNNVDRWLECCTQTLFVNQVFKSWSPCLLIRLSGALYL